MASYSRRDFGRLLGLSGAAVALAPSNAWARARSLDELAELGLTSAPLPEAPANTTGQANAVADEAYWRKVRSRFLVPPDVNFLNAANLCPSSLAAIEALEKTMRSYEMGPSPEARSELFTRGKEESRKLLAAALRVTPEEIVITRNTTEANNLVSSGLDLKAGDEVIVWADNHPSNLAAWQQKAQRFGFTVVTAPLVPSHPGTDGYVGLFEKSFTPRTKLVAITHVNSNSGDLLPAAEICAAARRRGILSLVDAAQSFGVLDNDLSVMKPDFFTGSLHKWPCGPKEKGVLFAAQAVHERIQPSIVGVYGGAVGLSRRFETNGQRDDAGIAAMTEGVKFQASIGRPLIEQRSRMLAQTLMSDLQKIPGVKLWTDPKPAHSAAIVIFQPGSLDIRQLGAALTAERIICTTRPGQQNPGLRMSPHFYNTMDEMHAAADAIRKRL
jgi:selenocysteine lyase/cysteine desulfurase